MSVSLRFDIHLRWKIDTFRANNIRPDTEAVASGIKKSQDAIENALCRSKAFNFDDLAEVIEALNQKTMKQDQLANQSRIFQEEEQVGGNCAFYFQKL